mgnify:FL=1
MEVINNVSKKLKDDLKEEIKADSRLSIAAACFSIYAFEELRKELEGIEELRFIFTSPSFTTEKASKERKEFYIPRLNRERSITGTEFEIKLRNELSQKAIARECADWIRRKVKFKSNTTDESMMGFMNVDDISYMPITGFTTAELGCEKGNNAYSMINKFESPFSNEYIKLFNSLWNSDKMEDVTDKVIENISAAYKENSPAFIYFVTLYNIFHEFLEDISEDTLPNEATGFKDSKIWKLLYNFQRDAALGIINKLEKYNGCILADSVGLGKTFTALAVIKYYENRNKSVLVLCPKKLGANWLTFRENYRNNPIAEDRLRYDVLFHTDLSRTHGYSNGKDLSMLNWSNYDLVVIDESHNFRNGGQIYGDEKKENRYARLMNQVIRKGVKTKVLMLSATPVNTKFLDLKCQLELAYEGDASNIDPLLNTKRSINDIFTSAQKAFNKWSKLKPEERTTDSLQKSLDFDFFELLDAVTIARSRKHIQTYYSTKDIGEFPTRLTPLSFRPPLTDLDKAITYNEIFDILMTLNLSVYTPSAFIHPSMRRKYDELYDSNKPNANLNQLGREQGIRYLIAVNLMKRMESSVHSFRLTLERIQDYISSIVALISQYEKYKNDVLTLTDISNVTELDSDEENAEDLLKVGRKVQISLADMDTISWKRDLEADLENLSILDSMVRDITPEYDTKLRELISVIENKVQHPINEGNRKVLIFTAFVDTAEYLYNNIAPKMKSKYGMDTALISGSVEGRSTIKGLRCDLNTVLTCFSPLSKDKQLLMPDSKANIDILIATDCISEGQNLQDCDYLINYDIHWNPVRIIQRFGRIDRIGSHNNVIQLVNFWPDITLDEYINLKSRVETRMKIVDLAAAGDDNILSPDEKADLDYRKEQLKKLQEEVVDIEDMSSGISIVDLGLNDFRMDLLEYIKAHPEIERAPFGLNAVTRCKENTPPGVIFVLKNRTNNVNIDNQNRLHPFYMVYVDMDGNVITDHLSPKKLLDKMRYLARDEEEPIPSVYKPFNKETRDGRNMKTYSTLLDKAIDSIIEKKSESDAKAFLSGGQISFINTLMKGLDDFELICFLIIREEEC